MTIGKRIKALLDDKGITQRELADKLDMSEVAISHYIHDRRIPNAITSVEIADFLGVTVEYLVRGDTKV